MDSLQSDNHLITLINIYNKYCRQNYTIESLELLYNHFNYISKPTIKKHFIENDEIFSDTFEKLLTIEEKLKRVRKKTDIIIYNKKLQEELDHFILIGL